MRLQPLRSVHRQITLDDVKSFSSFTDFFDTLISSEQVQSLDDLLNRRPELLGTILFNWYRQGQIACVFAQRLAHQPVKAKWQSITVNGEFDPQILSTVLEEAASRLEAVQLIFPGSGSTEHAIQIIRQLCKHPSWSCTEVDWMPKEHGEALLIGLRWHPATRKYVSWALGIAPFESMPFTRRFVGAPFIALVFRPNQPTNFAITPIDDKTGKPVSHLAHMDDLIGPDQAKRDQTNEITRRAKVALLGEESRSTARAKVTFALPPEYRTQLADLLVSIDTADDDIIK